MLATEFPFVVSELSYDNVSVFHKQGKAGIISHIVQVQTWAVCSVLITASVTFCSYVRCFFGVCNLGCSGPLHVFKELCAPKSRLSVKVSP